MTPLRPSRNSFHNMLEKVSTAPVGTPSERVKLRPRLCAALNMAKYARKMNDDPSIRKTWSPFFSLRGACALDMGPAYVWRRPSPYHPMRGTESLLPQVLVDYLIQHDSKGPCRCHCPPPIKSGEGDDSTEI